MIDTRNLVLTFVIVGTALTFVVLAMTGAHMVAVAAAIAFALTALAPFAAGAITQLVMSRTRLPWVVAGVVGVGIAWLLWYSGGVWFRIGDWRSTGVTGYLLIGALSAMVGAAVTRTFVMLPARRRA